MLYKTPRFSIAAMLRTLLVPLAGAFGEFRRTGADTAYLDSLPEHHLRDLGLRRFNDRNEIWYR